MIKYSIIGLLLFCFVTISTSSFAVAETDYSEALRVGATGSKAETVDKCTVRATITRAELESVLGAGVTIKADANRLFTNTDIPSGTVIHNQRDVCVFSLIKLVGRWLSIVAGVLASIFIVLSGILFMRSGGDTEKAGKAKALLLSAIVGFLIAGFGGTILRLIANLLI